MRRGGYLVYRSRQPRKQLPKSPPVVRHYHGCILPQHPGGDLPHDHAPPEANGDIPHDHDEAGK
jgi:hypothetical protein